MKQKCYAGDNTLGDNSGSITGNGASVTVTFGTGMENPFDNINIPNPFPNAGAGALACVIEEEMEKSRRHSYLGKL